MPVIDWSNVVKLLQYHPQQPLMFNTGLFLLLFPVVFLVYVLLSNQTRKGAITWLVFFSLFFYYKSSGIYWTLLLANGLFNWWMGGAISKSSSQKMAKLWLIIALIGDLGLLAVFKYFNLFGTLWSDLTGTSFTQLNWVLPVGISFFTFESISYVVDLYRGEIKRTEHNFLDYAFFVTFFPRLVAGPIVRAADVLPQVRQLVPLNRAEASMAFSLISLGLVKKAVISDYISVNFVDRVMDSPMQFSGVENLLAVYGYALQIFCDFSGYSDMAIGIALLFGFRLTDNFLQPYQSTNITEFWRRWHISLSSWLRDYLYIPLGGNRCAPWRQNLNLMITMLLGGLWHGASWNFLLWGGLHGTALVVEKRFKSLFGSTKDGSFKKLFSWFLTFHFVCFCWIFFRIPDFESAINQLTQITTAFHPEIFLQWIQGFPMVAVMMLLAIGIQFLPATTLKKRSESEFAWPLWVNGLALGLVIWLVIQTKTSDIQPFIYFQF